MPTWRSERPWSWKLPLALVIAAGVSLSGVQDVPAAERIAEIAPGLPPAGPMLQVGEELVYKVSYAFLNLGTIKIQVLDQREHRGKLVYHAKAYIDSNPSLGWLVDLHVLFESIVDRGIYSHVFLSVDSTEKEIVSRQIQFDYDAKRATIDLIKQERSKPIQRIRSDTIAISAPIQDGLSLFFYARENVLETKKVNVPTIIDDVEVKTFINFMGKRTRSEIDAINYPVDVLEFDGKADYVGIYGMTGGFRGWFSNDSARIPIEARMNVILGSVHIELLRWKRTNWIPPRFTEGKKP
ncbi:MAG: DUF3108 domain-containing protein [Ignavibacteria bacterium]|nr:DUF3108 domain-containing protein [Ignavibacteria bacterium]